MWSKCLTVKDVLMLTFLLYFLPETQRMSTSTSCWSHLLRRRWLRLWRVWFDRLDSGSSKSRLVSKVSAATSTTTTTSSTAAQIFSQTLSTSFLLAVLVLLFAASSVGKNLKLLFNWRQDLFLVWTWAVWSNYDVFWKAISIYIGG